MGRGGYSERGGQEGKAAGWEYTGRQQKILDPGELTPQILFAVLATRFVTAIHLGFAWVLIILAFCAAYYNMSITRVRHRARDDIQRELVKTRLVTETESADWMNQFADRFWLMYVQHNLSRKFALVFN